MQCAEKHRLPRKTSKWRVKEKLKYDQQGEVMP